MGQKIGITFVFTAAKIWQFLRYIKDFSKKDLTKIMCIKIYRIEIFTTAENIHILQLETNRHFGLKPYVPT